MERDSIVFYRSFYEAIKNLPPEEFKKCAMALMEYGLNGNEPETEGIERTVYIMAKPQIDKNNQRYTNGKNGGRKTNQTETEQKSKRNQTETKTEKVKPNDNDNVNVNDNVNENVNVNENDNGKKEKGAKAPKKKSGANAPVYFPLDHELDEAFRGFIDMRKQIKKPMTTRAVEMMINKINSIGDNNRAIECLNESTLHCWQTIYPEREKARGEPEKSGNPFMDIYNEMREAEENDRYGDSGGIGGY